MKKKLIKILAAVIIVVMLVIYFYPKPLNTIVISNKEITITKTVANVKNTELFVYSFLPKTDNYNEFLSILEGYSYHRNLCSSFNTGGLDQLRGCSYDIWFDNDFIHNAVEFDGTGEIIIDNHSYNIGFWGDSKAKTLVKEIEEFLKTQTPIPQN